MEWNAESVLDALNDFERKLELSPILEDYLKRIAKNGEIVFPWSKLKPLLKKKLEVVLDEFYETCPVETSVPVPNFETFNFDSLKKTILQAVDSFTSAPFTIQRLCELVTDPTKHYNRTDKYMRGIEKNVLVVSTIEPRSGLEGNANNPVVNGLPNDSPRDDNDTLNGHENTDNVSSSNQNNSHNHVLLENFANVFPSAACIPSASNICMNREIDNNFLSNSDCVESREFDEVELESNPPVEQIENASVKEEEMDTTEDEQACVSVNSGEITSSDVTPPGDSSSTEQEKNEDIKPSDDHEVDRASSSDSGDSVSASEDVKNEADCSESASELSSQNEEVTKPDDEDVQQDDTISQSNENVCNSSEESSTEKVSDQIEATETENFPVSSEVSQSAASSDSSDPPMDLGSSTDSTEPSV
ncbi:hypothetical protein CEXT_614251 [Caerostris extrusa]|uniref:Serine/threonine-protein phosphatase 4 regulatory subunit 2 n=1 Tax=Caerostris extrusa TaxID=172846 RepID=A0AAV4MF34_CAEEX|nr:hypothetical protein CEXT_614251 [Caerostris extrusa]